MTSQEHSPVAIATQESPRLPASEAGFFGGLLPDPAAVSFSPSEAGRDVAS